MKRFENMTYGEILNLRDSGDLEALKFLGPGNIGTFDSIMGIKLTVRKHRLMRMFRKNMGDKNKKRHIIYGIMETRATDKIEDLWVSGV